MRRILAIAVIAIRSAVRSRMVVSLLFLMGLAVIGLPLTLKGDGTAEGQLRIILTYSLGAAFALLALSSVWAGAMSIAQEIEERQIQLLAVKPVRRAEIWLGKWLGLMAVNTVLLLAAGAATAALLPRDLLDAQTAGATDWRAVFQPVAPQAEDLEAQAVQRYEQYLREGRVPEGLTRAQALEAVRQEVTGRSLAVYPGQRRDWRFTLPRAPAPGETIRLRLRFSAAERHAEPLRGRWMAGPPDQPDAWQLARTHAPEAHHVVEIPAGALRGSRELTLSYINEDPAHITIVFNPVDGLRLLLPAGRFTENYARALMLLLIRLGFLTALGVTAGALFSSPVALFMAVALIFMTQLTTHAGTDPVAGSGALRIMEQVSYALRAALAPLRGPPVLDTVATGLLVETAWLLRVGLIQLAAGGGLLALLGSGILARRELALPQN